jgi:cell shape-determining protein MreC
MAYFILVIIIVIEFIFHPIQGVLSFASGPIQGMGQGVVITLEGLGAFFTAKPSLQRDNDLLQEEKKALELELQRSSLFRDENSALRALLRVQDEGGVVRNVAQVIAHPPATAYDTLLIRVPYVIPDIGAPVFVGNIYIGTIEEVTANTALVRLVTSDTLTQDVFIGETSILLKGTGGGTFEVTVPKGFEIAEGQIISHVQFPTQPFAKVELIETDEVQAVQKVYLQALFSLHSIRYVNF